MPSRAQKGGVGFTQLYKGDNKSAFHFFMANAKSVKILTDNSVSCLTLIVELLPGIESPYLCLNPYSDSFMTSVNKILLKIMPSHNISDQKIITPPGAVKRSEITNADAYYKTVEINSIQQIARECNIQIDLYRKSMINSDLPLVPICPSVLYIENQIENHSLFWDYIKDKVDSRLLTNYMGSPVNDTEIITSFLNIKIPSVGDRNFRQYGGNSNSNNKPPTKKGKRAAGASPQPLYSGFGWIPSLLSKEERQSGSPGRASEPGLAAVAAANSPGPIIGNYSIIAMEFLEEYELFSARLKTIMDIPTGDVRNQYLHNISLLSSFEIRRLHQFGYFHNDLHKGNIMISPHELVATTDILDEAKTGKILIIDFGRTLTHGHIRLPGNCSGDLNTDECIKSEKLFAENKNIKLISLAEFQSFAKDIKTVSLARKADICSKLGIDDCIHRSIADIAIEKLSEILHDLLHGGSVYIRRKPTFKPQSPHNNNKTIRKPISHKHTENSKLSLGKNKHDANAKILGSVILNSLRQTQTYDELLQYLVEYKSKYEKKSQAKYRDKSMGIPTRILNTGPHPINVLSGGYSKRTLKMKKPKRKLTRFN